MTSNHKQPHSVLHTCCATIDDLTAVLPTCTAPLLLQMITNVSRSCHAYVDTSCGTSDQGADGCGPQLMQDVTAASAASVAAAAPGKHVPRHVGTFVGPVMVGELAP
jgi:hypothetical protein